MYDATHASLWVDTVQQPDLGDLSLKPRHYDVLVIGAGIVGVTTALNLAKHHKSVCLIEADQQLGVNTTTHSTVKATVAQGRQAGKIKNKLGEQAARLYIHANQFGLDQLKRIQQEHSIDCDLVEEPHWIYATNPSDVQHLHEERELLTRFGLSPQHRNTNNAEHPLPRQARMAFTLDQQIAFHPGKYLLRLIQILVNEFDVDLAINTRGVDVHERGEQVTTETNKGEITSDFVVVATHYPFLNRGGHFAKLTAQREYAIAGKIQDDTIAAMTYDIGQQTHSTRTYTRTHPNGSTERLLIVVGQGHVVGRADDAMENYTRLHQWANENYGLEHVLYRWSTQDPSSLDSVPYVGKINGINERIYTATGFGGWGMTNAHMAAHLITNDVLNAHTAQTKAWSQLFDATRLELDKNVKTFFSAQAGVAKALVSDHAKQLKSSGHPQQLNNNEHGLFEGPLKTIAAYRDNQGTLHQVSARCTHMGCLVRFNDAETSWDCPCHGSRFDIHGNVIEGPATEALHPIEEHVDLTKNQPRERNQ